MAGEILIKAGGLGKQYTLGPAAPGRPRHAAFRYKTLRESLTDAVKAPFRRGIRTAEQPAFWALKDVAFEIRRGEVIGIVGRNGAGKSTLLKILSRITDPTEGWVDIAGRVGSLLEVGTGFHPELTGRENVYLNGAILGMRTQEIAAKFDEIVRFAEVERFLDTPVKRYSSGMYVRLAFAVAAHLEPEILLVDEVLAVGDAAFQKKCLGKMDEISRQGRTVIFVSHNMQAIRQLCSGAIWFHEGRIARTGPAADVVDEYLASVAADEGFESLQRAIAELPPDPAFRLRDVRVLQDGRPLTDVLSGRPVSVEVVYDVLRESVGLHVFIQLRDSEGGLLFETIHNGAESEIPRVVPGEYASTAVIPADFLAPTRYELWVHAAIHGVRTCLPAPLRCPLTVTASGLVNRAYPGYHTPGKLAPLIDWRTERRAP